MFVFKSQRKYALESKPQSQVHQLPKANSYRSTLASHFTFQWKLEWTQKIRGGGRMLLTCVTSQYGIKMYLDTHPVIS